MIEFIAIEVREDKGALEEIKASLKEKEILLVEVHHRIKNNLNTIYSLLLLDADNQQQEDLKRILLDSSNRVRSMMLLYDKLYRSEYLSVLSIKDYFSLLILEIIGIFPNHDHIIVNFELDNVFLPAQSLSALGIMLNEWITNSMKHSFVRKEKGNIRLLAKESDRKIKITYSDDGIPFKSFSNLEKSKGFGLSLIQMLAEQIEGNLQFHSDPGNEWTLELKI